MKHHSYYLGQLRSLLKQKSEIPARREALDACRRIFKLATVEQAVLFLERRLEMGLETDPDALYVYDRCMALGSAVVNAQFKELEKEQAEKFSQGLTTEQRLQRLHERARREREQGVKKPQAVEAFKQRYQERQQAIVAAGERVLDGMQRGYFE